MLPRDFLASQHVKSIFDPRWPLDVILREQEMNELSFIDLFIASTRDSRPGGPGSRSAAGRTRWARRRGRTCRASPSPRGTGIPRRGSPGRWSCVAPRRRCASIGTFYDILKTLAPCYVSLVYALVYPAPPFEREGGGHRTQSSSVLGGRAYRCSSCSCLSRSLRWYNNHARWIVQ